MDSHSVRIRDLGYDPGVLPTGPLNSILDVPGVHVAQRTVPTIAHLPSGSTATKGLSIISPRPPNEFYKPCRASTFCFNGNGELTGGRQMEDWGYTATPIAFTNSVSLGTVFDGMWDWIMDKQDELGWDGLTKARRYATPVVGETADWIVNSEVRSSRLAKDDIQRCFQSLKSRENGGFVLEGQHGGGAGMTCHQFTGGTGQSTAAVHLAN
jgi:D-aminopeptidase